MKILTLKVEVKDGLYIVSDKELAEYGSGMTLAGALLDYFTSLVDFKAALQKIGREKLGSDLQGCLDLLNDINLGSLSGYCHFAEDSRTISSTDYLDTTSGGSP